ncbi:MAG: hypothetical protein EZS28_043483, partial [Streblomastix strix]
MNDSTKYNEMQYQKDPPRQDISNTDPEIRQSSSQIQKHSSKIQFSDLHSNIKDFLSEDADNYIQLEDEYMESKDCEVFVDERDGEVLVRFRSQIKAIVRENGHFEPEIKEELHYCSREFEYPEDLMIWIAYILSNVAQIKSSRLQDAFQSQSQTVTFRSQKQPVVDVFLPPKMIPVKRKR